MFVSTTQVLSLLSLSQLISALLSLSFDTAAYSPSCIIKRDVVVIGGGSSGTYAAIGVRDRGKSVAVVEAQSVLGGHTNTYTDPASGTTVDYGVVVFDNTTTVTSYFKRFDVPLTAGTGASTGIRKRYNVDFRTGKNVTNYVSPDPTAAFETYAAQLQKYLFLNTPGWNLPNPVLAELLIPFGDFVKKYKLDGAVPIVNSYSQGFGDTLSILTLYIMKYFSLSVLQGAQTGFLTTVRHDNSEIYVKARAELGSDVFLNSKVLATQRNDKGVKVVIQTPTGNKLILAKKAVISIPPLLSKLAGFDLSKSERSLFGQFLTGAYYTGLLRNTGIPDDVSITAVGADTPYNLPQVPTLYGITPTALRGIKDIKFGNSAPLSDAAVKAAIVSQVQKLKTADTIPTASTPEFVAYNSHTPYELRVSADAVAKGFYRDLTALQGQKSTYWTGAAFNRHDSGDMWAFTEGLLGRVVA